MEFFFEFVYVITALVFNFSRSKSDQVFYPFFYHYRIIFILQKLEQTNCMFNATKTKQGQCQLDHKSQSSWDVYGLHICFLGSKKFKNILPDFCIATHFLAPPMQFTMWSAGYTIGPKILWSRIGIRTDFPN